MPNPNKLGDFSPYLSNVTTGPKPPKKPDRPTPKGKTPRPKGKGSTKNPWANPKVRQVAALQLVLDVTKYVRNTEFQEDHELALRLNKYAEQVLKEITKLKQGMTKEELAELARIDQVAPDQTGRHPLQPK
jgi:hypothetical protein